MSAVGDLTWELCDLNQNVLATVTTHEPGAQVTIGREIARTATLSLDLDDPVAVMAAVGTQVLRCRVAGWPDPLFVGRVLQHDITYDGDTAQMKLSAADPLAMLEAASLIGGTAMSPSAETFFLFGFGNVDPSAMMNVIVSSVNDNGTGLIYGGSVGNAADVPLSFPYGSSAADALRAIAGLDDMPEFDIRPYGGPFNLVSNPSFAADASGWTNVGGLTDFARVTGQPATENGTTTALHIGKATTSGSAEYQFPVIAGRTYTVSLYSSRELAATPTTNTFEVLDASNVQKASTTLFTSPSYVRRSLTFTADATGTWKLRATVGGGGASGENHGWITDVQIDQGSVLNAFVGNTPFDTLAKLWALYPRMGADKTGTIKLRLGLSDELDELLGFEMAPSMSGLVNRHVVVGDAPEGSIATSSASGSPKNYPLHPASRASHAGSISQYGVWETTEGVSGTSNATTLQKVAKGNVAANRNPVTNFKVTLDPDNSPTFGPTKDFWIGDTITVQITTPQGRVITQTGRIAAAGFTEDEGGDVLVDLTLEPEDDPGGVTTTALSVVVDSTEGTDPPPPEPPEPDPCAPVADTGGPDCPDAGGGGGKKKKKKKKKKK